MTAIVSASSILRSKSMPVLRQVPRAEVTDETVVAYYNRLFGDRDPVAEPGTATGTPGDWRSEEHTSELQSLMRISYAVFCLKKKKNNQTMHMYHSLTYYKYKSKN